MPDAVLIHAAPETSPDLFNLAGVTGTTLASGPAAAPPPVRFDVGIVNRNIEVRPAAGDP